LGGPRNRKASTAVGMLGTAPIPEFGRVIATKVRVAQAEPTALCRVIRDVARDTGAGLPSASPGPAETDDVWIARDWLHLHGNGSSDGSKPTREGLGTASVWSRINDPSLAPFRSRLFPGRVCGTLSDAHEMSGETGERLG